MAELSSFFDANLVNGVPDREYDATAWANYFSGFIGNGVSNSPADNLQVTAGTGLSVIVNSGIGYINGYYYNNTEPLTVNINIANATYPRITSIVVELNLNNRAINCITVDGTAQTNPTAPQLIQTPSTYQLQLATVYVPPGATSIGQITDTRSNSNVCGIMTINAPTAPPPIIATAEITGGVVVNEAGGSINFNNQNGTNILNEGVDGDTFILQNIQTGNNIISVTPVTTGTDTVDVNANINLMNVLNAIGGNAGVNFTTSDNKYTIGIGAYSNDDKFIFVDNTNGNTLWEYNPTTKEFNLVNSTLSSPTLTQETTVQGGLNITPSGAIYFTNASGTEVINTGINNGIFQLVNTLSDNPWISCTPVTSGIDTVNIECNTNFMQAPNLTGGLQAMGSNVVQYNSFNYSAPVGTNTNGQAVNVSGTISYFLINGYLLGGENETGSIGIMTMTATLDNWYIWPTNNELTISVPGIPSATANTLSPNNVVQFGTQENTLYLYGTGQALDNGTTYTTKGILWQ